MIQSTPIYFCRSVILVVITYGGEWFEVCAASTNYVGVPALRILLRSLYGVSVFAYYCAFYLAPFRPRDSDFRLF
jgi:hypothetical protein